jgi:hypothetical protein
MEVKFLERPCQEITLMELWTGKTTYAMTKSLIIGDFKIQINTFKANNGMTRRINIANLMLNTTSKITLRILARRLSTNWLRLITNVVLHWKSYRVICRMV